MRAALLSLLLLPVAAGGWAVAHSGNTSAPAGMDRARQAYAAERLIRDEDIAFYRRRVGRDPEGAIDLARLGSLLLTRYREEGIEADLAEAESVARLSLAHRNRANGMARRVLAGALLGQHRFVEARELARELVAMDPEDTEARSRLGEILLELGEYHEADSIFRRLTPLKYEPGISARYARWLELSGRSGEARRLLESGRQTLGREGAGAPISLLAWYDLRLGELAMRARGFPEARRTLDRGLSLAPGDWRLLSARARLALIDGDPRRAIALGDSSLGVHLDPATLAVVGEGWQALNNPAKAEEYFRALEAASGAPRGGFHRAWYLALLNHDRRLDPVLRAVLAELPLRPDAYGYDLAAWALFKNGRAAEARPLMREALRRGIRDAQLEDHARILAGAP